MKLDIQNMGHVKLVKGQNILTGFWPYVDVDEDDGFKLDPWDCYYDSPDYIKYYLCDSDTQLEVDGVKYYIPELKFHKEVFKPWLDDIVINVDGVKYVLYHELNKFDRLCSWTLNNFRKELTSMITNKQVLLEHLKEKGFICH